MLLEKYIDMGILLERMLTRARQGDTIHLHKGIIEINGVKSGVEDVDYTSDIIERALNGV